MICFSLAIRLPESSSWRSMILQRRSQLSVQKKPGFHVLRLMQRSLFSVTTIFTWAALMERYRGSCSCWFSEKRVMRTRYWQFAVFSYISKNIPLQTICRIYSTSPVDFPKPQTDHNPGAPSSSSAFSTVGHYSAKLRSAWQNSLPSSSIFWFIFHILRPLIP